MAADLKDPIALINLGTIYEDGYEGVAPDRAKAFNCYEEASKLNNALAYFHLGLMYEAVI
jgi:TPR repeat protein